jgi:hypothetical protein
MLSPRIIHFAAGQVFWDCQELVSCESVPAGVSAWEFKPGRFMPVAIIKQSLELVKPAVGIDKAIGKWAAIVTAYCSSSLTYKSDKIMAIAGVADRLEQLWGFRYCAGLWREQMELQLCWRADSSLDYEQSPLDDLSAPSWSWLAYDGVPTMTRIQDYDGFDGFDLTLKASVTKVNLRYEVSKDGVDIIRGNVKLRCFLNRIAYVSGEGFCVMGEDGVHIPVITEVFDHRPRPAREELYFVPIYEVRSKGHINALENDESELKGLLVSVIQRAFGTFRRCGHVFMKDWITDNGSSREYLAISSAKGKDNLPCAEFDPELGHLISLV